MRSARRLISGILSFAMVFSLLAAGLPRAEAASADGPTGSIGLTIRFDLPQSAANAAGRSIQLQVSRGGQRTVVPLPAGTAQENGLGATVSSAVKNVDGVELTTETRVGYYQVELSGLPAGGAEYELSLTGTGYKTFRQSVTLDGYGQHVIVGTGDGTFSLGDVDGNGAVNDSDLSAMDARLGGQEQLAVYDLNGDGKVDVTDLAYVNRVKNATGQAQVLETAAIVSPRMEASDFVADGDDVADLFRDEGTVTILPSNGAVELPIVFDEADGVEMSRIRITCPDGFGAGAVQAGRALVELADGTTLTVPFDAGLPADVHAIGEEEGRKVVAIDLGKKVAVKKVTIQVTSAASETGFATVTKIEFLKDIVPENPQCEADQVKGVTATAGDGRVTLTWNAVNNVTGYTVAYGTGVNALTQSAATNTNQTVITGLDNLKTYYFQVTAVNGDWKGTPSRLASAMPQPAGAPGAPSNIRITESDQSLRLSWGSTRAPAIIRCSTAYRGRARSSSLAVTSPAPPPPSPA